MTTSVDIANNVLSANWYIWKMCKYSTVNSVQAWLVQPHRL
jgi:hypothetical protein